MLLLLVLLFVMAMEINRYVVVGSSSAPLRGILARAQNDLLLGEKTM
jgi:hypothetical protein